MAWNIYDFLGWTVLLASVIATTACLIRGWRKDRARGAAWVCVAAALCAPVLGLLGTIAGLFTAFEAVDSADAAERATFLARGISEAMSCTALGLTAMLPPAVATVMLFVRAPSKPARAH